jgi:hypothetical protein
VVRQRQGFPALPALVLPRYFLLLITHAFFATKFFLYKYFIYFLQLFSRFLQVLLVPDAVAPAPGSKKCGTEKDLLTLLAFLYSSPFTSSFLKLTLPMANRPTPGVVANSLVRYILTQAGLAAGGLSNEQWQRTLQAFNGCCAYTGQPLAPAEKEHAVPMNRTQGGLHVFGNVLPATGAANREKGGLRYDVFLRAKGERFKSVAHLTDEQREARIAHIEAFMQAARTDGLLASHPELLAFYAAQYEQAKELCANSVEQLTALLAKLNVTEEPATDATATPQDVPTPEQFELEETDLDALPEPYRTIQDFGSQTNVGSYAQAIFRQLFADGRIAALLPALARREDSFTSFKLSFPALVTHRPENGGRYYATPYHYEGTEYYLCSQWYERHRAALDTWLATLVADL